MKYKHFKQALLFKVGSILILMNHLVGKSCLVHIHIVSPDNVLESLYSERIISTFHKPIILKSKRQFIILLHFPEGMNELLVAKIMIISETKED